MARDRYGLALSTGSPEAVTAYVDGVDRFLAAHDGAEECFARAVAADPEFALGHIGQARSLQLAGRGADARAAAALGQARGAMLDRRERQHVEALSLAVAGQGARALALIREHLAEFPRDAMVLAAANGVYGLIGFSGRQERNEEMLALLDGLATAYGDDWWFLGAHGFARTEALGWLAGAPVLERALALAPRNAHAAHAWAHVLYERGDDASGEGFVTRWLPEYPRAAPLHCHISWHLALFELGCGRPAAAMALFESSIRPRHSPRSWIPRRSSGAASWRASHRGGRPGTRWPSTRGRRSPRPGSRSSTCTARPPSPPRVIRTGWRGGYPCCVAPTRKADSPPGRWCPSWPRA
jgi:hypothetical protein